MIPTATGSATDSVQLQCAKPPHSQAPSHPQLSAGSRTAVRHPTPPPLLKMVSEPLQERRHALSATNVKLGLSHSQDNECGAASSLCPSATPSPSHSYNGGRTSPQHSAHVRGSVSTASAPRAANLRLKFRKSHTCGSLYANCNCSSPPPVPSGAHHHNNTNTNSGSSSGALMDASTQRVLAERFSYAAANAAATHSSFTYSISPTSADASYASTQLTSATSGYHTLSAQTSAATSAQLSHDESMSASFELFSSGGAGGAFFATNESTIGGGAGGAFFATNESAIGGGDQHQQQQHSPVGARLASVTENEVASAKSRTLQVPQIASPSAETAPIPAAAPNSLSTSPSVARKSERKTKRFFQSYSHPDTDYIFTDENKKPSKESLIQIHVQHHEKPVIKSRGGKVEIKQPKRSSSPNIGQYQVLDVAVHPDILVKISPRHSPIAETRRLHSPLATRSAEQRRRLLQRSHEIESGGSTSESEHSFDVRSPTGGVSVRKDSPGVADASGVTANKSKPVSPTVAASLNAVVEDASFDAAQKYFAESGILGPINTSSQLIRKTSKILQDANVIEQIRKTSMILRANSAINNGHNNSNNNNNSSSATTKPAAPITTSTSTALLPAPPLALMPAVAPFKFCRPNNASMQASATIDCATTTTTPQSPHSMATTCGFSPNMTTKSCAATDDRDAQIKSLQGEVVSLKDVIKSRDAEIVKMRREIHKLKSVLQQTTNPLPIANDELLQSPTSPPQGSNRYPPGTEQTCATCKKRLELEPPASNATGGRHTPESSSSMDSNLSENYQSCTSTSTGHTAVTCALATNNTNNNTNTAHAANQPMVEIALDAAAAAKSDALACNGLKPNTSLHVNHHHSHTQPHQVPVLKKQGVSGESCETSMQQSINEPIPKYNKDFSSKQLIKDAIMDNDFLKNIDASQVRELVESMYPLSIAKGEFVIREGEAGAHLYVSAAGEFEVVKNGKVLGIMGPGKAFGELAILYNCTRTASIRVLSDARVWVLDRRVFQQIMMRTGMQRIENSVNFLRSVPLLKNLSMEVLTKIADVLEVEFYAAGTYIIRQGASGDTFFLISQGSVKVTQKLTPTSEEKEIRTLERGDYFGEQALINEDKRTANIIAMAPGVECLTLDRDSFTQLIGDLCELKEKNYGDENRVLAMKYAEKKGKEIFGANVKQEFPDLKLTDMEVVTTLGIGGFGRVELVKAYRENRVDIFALKCLKKKHIVDTKQEEHVFSERTIMLTCNTPFICRLYRTFRDEKYVYMLLEACMGGEIWTMLRDRGCFDENATQFIIGCVLQAFEYLHARGIIYRDLKPENLMLDERGYVKLVDFGFAKYIGNSNKTWTFCGTPEYVAPEIILNKGHDRAVDYWALGVLIHELLNGTPPFTANDPMKTYNIILKGIDMINFPKHMSRSAVQLIKKLCRDVPAERLGYQKGGIQNIKKHKWFLGFDWDGLEQQLLIPPFVRPIAHPTDSCYFDKFPCDPEEPPDELSGWDADF